MPRSSPSLLRIAIDLTSSLCSKDRHLRLLAAVRSLLPCDATALLALDGGELVPVATHGLMPQVLGMRFPLDQHPRLARIIASEEPVRFPSDSPLPDPFDGLVEASSGVPHDVHDCLGCPLIANGVVVGALTADALATDAFDELERDELIALAALAGAAMQTTQLIETVERLAERRGLVVRELTREAVTQRSQMLGVSPVIEALRAEIETVAASDLAVLVAGETGVGKELAARAVHAGSGRDGPLIHVNCAALPESLVDSELFGHVRGAFTGATANRAGKFEVADGGTLFLDEIGELPLSVQPKLLRALQDGEIQRVGSDKPVHVDVRIVAATNRVVEDEVAAGRFRADLYHRLNVYRLQVPPLRARPEDIEVLAGHFLDRYRTRLGLGQILLGSDAAQALRRHAWPGNVRELDHVLARAALRASARATKGERVKLQRADLDLDETATPPASVEETLQARTVHGTIPLREAVDEFKRGVIRRALDETDGNWAEAARRLGLHRSNLHHLARRLDLQP